MQVRAIPNAYQSLRNSEDSKEMVASLYLHDQLFLGNAYFLRGVLPSIPSCPPAGFQRRQTLALQSKQPQLNSLAYDSQSRLLLLGNALGSTLIVLHLTASLDSFDSVARYEAVVPIISLEALQNPVESSDSDAIQVKLCFHLLLL